VALVVRPGHPLLSSAAPDLLGIARYPLLWPPPGSVILPAVERLFAAHRVPPPARVIETVSDAFGRRFVLATDAVWAISEGVVAADLAEDRLRRLPVGMEDTSGPVGVTARAGEIRSAAQQALVAAVRAVLTPN
jgi:LysR family pca operon transcriptional activator